MSNVANEIRDEAIQILDVYAFYNEHICFFSQNEKDHVLRKSTKHRDLKPI
jgi:hypothetical protein